MRRIRLLILLASLSCGHNLTYGNCFQNIDSLVIYTDIKRLNLHSDQNVRLSGVIRKSKKRIELNKLLRDLSSSHLLGAMNLIKRRSKDIVDAVSLLDSIDFDSSWFLLKIIRGEKLSLLEKRAYYLLIKRQFWFEGNLYKNSTSNFLDSISLTRFFQKQFDKLAYTTELDSILFDLTKNNPQQILFSRAHTKISFEHRIREFFSSYKNEKNILSQIDSLEELTLRLMTESNGVTYRYYSYRYDQIQAMKYILLDEAFSVEEFQIRNSRLFARVPNALLTLESISKVMAYMMSFSFAIDQSIKYTFRFKIVSREDFNVASPLPHLEQPKENYVSLEELLEEQFNSGDISYEEFLEAIGNLNN